jgi:choice-of-anchor A domain-containing protein
MSARSLLMSAILSALGILAAQHAFADSIANYDVVTTGNLIDVGGDIYGNTFVGGKLTASNSSQFGKNTSGNKVSVAGNVTGGSNIQLVGGGTLTYHGTLDHALASGTAVYGTVSSSSGFATEMTTDSNYFASLAANSVFNQGSNSSTFTTTPTYISGLGETSVFKVTSAQLFNQNEALNLAASGTINTIIIDVSGTSDITQGGQNFTGNWSSYDANIIWNFTNATTITLNTAWQGTILAPLAAVTLNSACSDVYGAVYASSLDITSGNEIRNDLYIPVVGGTNPNVPPAVPLPLPVWSGTILLTALGIRRLKSTRTQS